MRRWLNHKIPELWGKRCAITYGLLPFSFGFQAVSAIRRYAYRYYFKPDRLNVPVIVVGNISVGGTGKTPFVIWLANALKKQGFFPGIITRGYKGTLTKQQELLINEKSLASEVGDEAVVLAKNAKCPVAAGRKRVKAAQLLLKAFPEVNIIISDDGLQHYALARDLEIAIVDGARLQGNGFCLPAGPLREPIQRLKTVDFVITNGGEGNADWPMQTTLCDTICQVKFPKNEISLLDLQGQTVHAVAGIGSPDRFFNALKAKNININIIEHRFPDHHRFQKQDLNFKGSYLILMTEKDAVKCEAFAPENAWFASAAVSLPEDFISHIIRRITDGQEAPRHPSLPNLQTTRHL